MQLQELLAANQPLATVYVLKDALKEIWYASSVGEATLEELVTACTGERAGPAAAFCPKP